MSHLVQACLLSDGSSDRMLIPIIEWTMKRKSIPFQQVKWVNLSLCKQKPNTLKERIEVACSLYEECNLLFIHRDAENQAPLKRFQEIEASMKGLNGAPIHVPIVPIRMSEAWLLFDEKAIRYVASKPSGREPLNLPSPKEWERLPNPKEILENAFRVASESTGRDRKRLNQNLSEKVHQLAHRIQDFSPLLSLSAYQKFEEDLDLAIRRMRAP